MVDGAWRVAVGWLLMFTALHVYWGVGGTNLLPGVSVLDSAALLVMDLVAIPVCLGGAVIAWLLRPGQRLGKLRARRWLLWPGTVACALMLGHALTGAIVAVASLPDGVSAARLWSLRVYEPFWLVGGLALLGTVGAFERSVAGQSLQRKKRRP